MVGSGASTIYGAGGGWPSALDGANGTNATGYGSGGGPAAVRAVATNYAGGNGAQGIIIVEEYF